MLFDTSVLIAHLRNVPEATELLLRSAMEGAAFVSVLSRVEVEGGMRSSERAIVAQLFGRLRLEPVTDPIAAQAASYARSYRRSHRGIDAFDYVIAATSEILEQPLATLNVKHFPMFKRLRPAF